MDPGLHRLGDKFRAIVRVNVSGDGAKGSVISLGGFLQDQLVERQVRDRLTEPGVLLFKVLDPLDLVRLQAAILLAPSYNT
jgi:hypothetical protein